MLRHRRLLLILALITGALVASACGGRQFGCLEGETTGTSCEVGSLTYQVQLSRYLNPADTEDRWYFSGLPAGTTRAQKGDVWFGVWVQVRNNSDRTQTPTDQFSIVDTQNNVYRPIPLDARVNPFAYNANPIAAGGMTPTPGSPAASGPVQGSLLLFKLKVDSLQNRPLDLHIEQGAGNTATYELDL